MLSQIRDSGDLRKYRTEIPNIIDDMDLSVYAFRLYVHFKRVAGDSGQCYQGTRKIAESCKISVGKVSQAKQELEDAGLIEIDSRETWQSDLITIVDIWPANFAHFVEAKIEKDKPVHDMNDCSPHEHPVQDMNTPFTTRTPTVHHMNERKNPIKKEPNKKEPREEESASAGADGPTPDPDSPVENYDAVFGPGTINFDPPPVPEPKRPIEDKWNKPLSEMEPPRAMFAAVLDAIGWDRKTLTERDRGQVAQACRKMREAGYEYADVGEFMRRIWFQDWRWTDKASRPTLNQLRQEIGKLRAGVPENMPRRQSQGADAVDSFFDRLERQGVEIYQ